MNEQLTAKQAIIEFQVWNNGKIKYTRTDINDPVIFEALHKAGYDVIPTISLPQGQAEQIEEMVKYLLGMEPTQDKKTIESYTKTFLNIGRMELPDGKAEQRAKELLEKNERRICDMSNCGMIVSENENYCKQHREWYEQV